jgi:outer membrane protein
MRMFLTKMGLLAVLLTFGVKVHALPDAKNSTKTDSSAKRYDLLLSIQTALENNAEIKKARERIQKQRGVLIQARAGYLPHLSLNSNIQQVDKERLQTLGGTRFGTQNDWAVNIELTQSLYTGGRLSAGYEREKLNLDASLLEFQRIVADVLLHVRERYYGVLLAREQVQVHEQHIKLLQEELETEQNRFKAGSVSNFNVLRAEVELANSRTPLIRSRNTLRLAIEQLRNVLGLPQSLSDASQFEVIGEFQYEPKSVELNQALVSALEKRPELKQLEKISKAELAKIKMEAANYKPTIEAVAGYGVEKSRFSSSLKDEVHGWTAGVRGTWNLFDGLATKGRVQEAKSDYQISVINLEQQRLDVDVEVRQAHSSLTEADQLVQASKKVVDQAEESLRIAKSRLDVGASTQLDVLEAQVALTQARTNVVLALHDYHVAYARLTRATGESEKFSVVNP